MLPRSAARQCLLACLILAIAGCAPRTRLAQAPPPPRATPAAPHRPPTLRDAMLRIHALARAAAGVPPLAWDDGLAAQAQGWASTLARSGGFRHAAAGDEGENLWQGTRGAYSPAEMAGYWVGERRWFAGPAHPLASRTGRFRDVGHYSQVVWRATRRMGCGLASNARDDVLVCRYWPAGNVEGETAY